MEYLDIVDECGNPTGEIMERSEVHKKGIRHRTSHVWLMKKEADQVYVLLQKRSDNKDSFPGCYDISSAGHIPAGVGFEDSAIRELQEELGYEAKKEELIYCGQRSFSYEGIFHGSPFRDCQISNVYLLWTDKGEEEFVLQKEEVQEVKWFLFEECVKAVENGTIPHCIYLEELKIIREGIRLS